MSDPDSPPDATSRLRDRWRDSTLETHSAPTNEVAPLPDNSGLPNPTRPRVKTGSGSEAPESQGAAPARPAIREPNDDDTGASSGIFGSRAPTSSDIATALLFGALTAAAAVAVEVAIEFSVFYFYIVPIGPLALGVLSGLGAALVARHRNLTITWGLWGAVGAITAVSYFIILGLQHAAFNADYSATLGFWDWFTLSTELMSISNDEGISQAELGNFGYVFRALDFVGIVAGSLFIMLQLKKNPYEDAM